MTTQRNPPTAPFVSGNVGRIFGIFSAMAYVTATAKASTMPAVMPLRRRPLDAFLVFWFCLFAVSSLVFEQFIVFGVDLSTTTDIFGRTWYWYARSFDPVFLETPSWLRIMCTIDAYVFGPFYLVLVYALTREKNWIRIPALLYGATIVYSTAVYFGYELFDEANRGEANLLAVFLVNIPFTVVPLLLMWRMRQPDPFRTSS